MAMYIRCELTEAGRPMVPEYLKFEANSGEDYELCWNEITFVFETGSLTCMDLRLKDLSLVDAEGKRIEDNSEITRICSQFKRFSDITWTGVGYENDSVSRPTILQVVLDITEPIVMYKNVKRD